MDCLETHNEHVASLLRALPLGMHLRNLAYSQPAQSASNTRHHAHAVQVSATACKVLLVERSWWIYPLIKLQGSWYPIKRFMVCAQGVVGVGLYRGKLLVSKTRTRYVELFYVFSGHCSGTWWPEVE